MLLDKSRILDGVSNIILSVQGYFYLKGLAICRPATTSIGVFFSMNLARRVFFAFVPRYRTTLHEARSFLQQL